MEPADPGSDTSHLIETQATGPLPMKDPHLTGRKDRRVQMREAAQLVAVQVLKVDEH